MVHTSANEMVRVLAPFAPLFSRSVFQDAQVLFAGAILIPGIVGEALVSEAYGCRQWLNVDTAPHPIARTRTELLF